MAETFSDYPAYVRLLTLPPAAARVARVRLTGNKRPWHASCDPPGPAVGSGGGTSAALVSAWRDYGGMQPFGEWLEENRVLLVHAGGQSRRLPAYAPSGKAAIPIPVRRGSVGQSLDQDLLSLQEIYLEQLMARAGASARLLVACGDMLLTFAEDRAPLPDADVVILGMPAPAEVASGHGALLVKPDNPTHLVTFLQKAPVERLRQLQREYHLLLDTGVWLLSGRAVDCLLRASGWNGSDFEGGAIRPYEMYAGMGPSLGAAPHNPDSRISSLTSAVATGRDPGYLHLGATRQLIQACATLQAPERLLNSPRSWAFPSQLVLNSAFDPPIRTETNHTLWVENSVIGAHWQLAHDHCLTGVPENDWHLRLPAGVCLDFVPLDHNTLCIRFYGLDDTFRGPVGHAETEWLGAPAECWFHLRGLALAGCGMDPEQDIYGAALFPVMPSDQVDPDYLQWLIEPEPEERADFAERWRTCERLSAADLNVRADVALLEQSRQAHRKESLFTLYAHHRNGLFHGLDLLRTAEMLVAAGGHAPRPPEGLDPLTRANDEMWRATLLQLRGEPGETQHEQAAFAALREAIVEHERQQRVFATCDVLEDQIVWARAPVRLDLAGGWTDTPPFCLRHGGSVTNVAVDLNGQPPIQVFLRTCEQPHIVIRSIDLGVEQRFTTLEEIQDYARPGSEFALAKAALALAGFHPEFGHGDFSDGLRSRLREFGGGIEISLLAAVPQGSGLGTSSILAATLLGGLSSLCGLKWSHDTLVSKTLALEQMLTTGGGWQDQVGGIWRGVKRGHSEPGIEQQIGIHWLPEHLLCGDRTNREILLYYTGVTRLAKQILKEIVRGMFLNSARHLRVLERIGQNSHFVADAIQRADWERLCEGVRRSWRLNCELDPGTDPEPIRAILASVEDLLSAAKLLGAGGGGYLLMFAKDADAGARIRQRLRDNPPNDRARFVDMSVSSTGLEVTRS